MSKWFLIPSSIDWIKGSRNIGSGIPYGHLPIAQLSSLCFLIDSFARTTKESPYEFFTPSPHYLNTIRRRELLSPLAHVHGNGKPVNACPWCWKNNSRINLALFTASLNARNHKVSSRRNTSGTNGISKLKTGKCKSSRYYRVDTTFDTEEEAIQDRLDWDLEQGYNIHYDCVDIML